MPFGDLTDGASTGAPADFAITPFDAHGNAGASGGRFAVELVRQLAPGEEGPPSAVDCAVTESASGAEAAGHHALSGHPVVCGHDNEADQVDFGCCTCLVNGRRCTGGVQHGVAGVSFDFTLHETTLGSAPRCPS